MSGYELSRSWFNYCLENPEKVKPNHTALFFWIVENFNRFEWKPKIGLPTGYAMEVLGIRSYNTYISALNDLVEFGFVIMIEKSKNQYSSNIIALSKNDKARNKATSKHMIEHTSKQSESIVQSTGESNSSIIKPINNKTLKPKNLKEEGSSDLKNPPTPKVDFKKLIDFFNEHRGNCPEIKIISKPRETRISNLIKNHSKEKLMEVILTCESSDFIQGTNNRNWIADFDWITKPANFIKILEGNYNNKENGKSNSNPAGTGSGKISGRSTLSASADDYREFA